MGAPVPATALGITSYRWSNDIKSLLMLAAFPALLLAIVAGIMYVFGYASLDTVQGATKVSSSVFSSLSIKPVLRTMGPGDLAVSACYAWWPAIFGAAACWTLIGYAFNGAMIRMATGAKPLDRREAPELYNILENLCISRGQKMPPLYVIDTDALNAFASGIDQSSYAVTVTRGLVERLDKRELEAVLGHELTHIVNKDCRLLVISIVFTGMVSFLAQMMWRNLQYGLTPMRPENSGENRERQGRGGANVAALMVISAIMLAIGYALAILLRFALSRRREYMADAGAVELTKNPEALISALRKISKASEIPNVPPEVRQMFIENPPSFFDFGGLFATHPPIEDRIAVLQRLGGLPTEGKSLIPKT